MIYALHLHMCGRLSALFLGVDVEVVEFGCVMSYYGSRPSDLGSYPIISTLDMNIYMHVQISGIRGAIRSFIHFCAKTEIQKLLLLPSASDAYDDRARADARRQRLAQPGEQQVAELFV